MWKFTQTFQITVFSQTFAKPLKKLQLTNEITNLPNEFLAFDFLTFELKISFCSWNCYIFMTVHDKWKLNFLNEVNKVNHFTSLVFVYHVWLLVILISLKIVFPEWYFYANNCYILTTLFAFFLKYAELPLIFFEGVNLSDCLKNQYFPIINTSQNLPEFTQNLLHPCRSL